MARQLDTGGRTAKREDLHALDPRGIIFDINDNYRWHPPGQEFKLVLSKVIRYAKQFINPKTGQLQPIGVRIAEGRKPKAVYGFHRLAAALMVVEGNEEHGIPAHPEFLIRCVVKDLNEAEAAEAAIRENKDREGTTAIDDAENLRRLRVFGRDDTQIMDVLGISKKWIGTLEKLLKLPDPIKLAVHNRLISIENGAALAEQQKDKQDEYISTALKEVQTPIERELDGANGDVSPEVASILSRMALTTEAARQEATVGSVNSNGKASTATGKPKAANSGQARKLNTALKKALKKGKTDKGEIVHLDRKEMLSFWDFLFNDADSSETEKAVAKAITEHAAGKKGDQALRNTLKKCLRSTIKTD